MADTLLSLSLGALPPAARVLVDRAIMRILPRFAAEPGSRLALHSFTSSRALRRRAAVKFYRIHGIDEEARDCVLDQIGAGEAEAPELIAMDSDLIGTLGLDYALAVAPSTSYRKCTVETAMNFMTAPVVAECCIDYPQELVWAVNDQCSAEYCSIIVSLAINYRSDLYLLNRIVKCVAKVGNDRQLEVVVAIARAELGIR